MSDVAGAANDFLGLAQAIVAIAMASPIGKWLSSANERKKYQRAYEIAFTNFFDSYGKGDTTLVVNYRFFCREKVCEEMSRLATGGAYDLEALIEEFRLEFPEGDGYSFPENLGRFRRLFQDALLSTKAISTESRTIISNLEMENSDVLHELSELKQIVSLGFSRALSENRVFGAIGEHYGASSSPHDPLDLVLDGIRELIDMEMPKAALKQLEDNSSRLSGPEAPTRIRFRYLTNLGASHSRLGRFEQAADNFEAALQLYPNDPKALANAALAKLIRKEFAQANELAERALSIQADQTTALSAIIEASTRLNVEIPERIRLRAEQHADSRRALAMSHMQRGEFRSAEVLLRKTITLDEAETQDLVLLAQTIVQPIQQQMEDDRPLAWRLPGNVGAELSEAIRLLDQAAKEWLSADYRARIHEVFLARGMAYSLLSDTQNATNDFQRILLEDANNPEANYNLGVLSLISGRADEAIVHLLKAIGDPILASNARHPLATAYIMDKKPRNALSILRNTNDDDASNMVDNLQHVFLTAWAAHNAGDLGVRDNAIQELVDWPSQDAVVHERLGQVYETVGNMNAAKNAFQVALTDSTGTARDRISLQLAMLHFHRHEFKEAAAYYRDVVPMSRESEHTLAYVMSLANSHQWQEALSVARTIRNDGPAIPIISEAEAKVLAYIGELSGALNLFEQLAEIEPDHREHNFSCAYILLRQGRLDDAACRVEHLAEDHGITPEQLLDIARILVVAGRPAAAYLPLAYRAHRLLPSDPNSHTTYVSMFMKASSDSTILLDADTVQEGTSVHLLSGPWYTIVDGKQALPDKGELLLTDDVAQALLGRKAGDIVRLRIGPLGIQNDKVSEVQSKYVRAFQEVFEVFNRRFPNHRGLFRLEFDGTDLSQLYAISDLANADRTQKINYYLARNCTLEQLANLTGTGVVAAWASQSDSRILAAAGTQSEISYNREIVAGIRQGVTIDITGLLTLCYLGLLPDVAAMFGPIYVAQYTIDTLLEESHHPHTIPIENEFLRRHIFSNSDFAARVIDQVRSHCKVMPVSGALALEYETFDALEEMLGKASFASVLVAKVTETVLLSDDLYLRGFARWRFDVDAAWTLPVLEATLSVTTNGVSRYFDALYAVMRLSYDYVPASALFILHTLRKNSWSINGVTTRAFANISSSATSEESAIQVVADVVYGLWNADLLPESRYHCFDQCLWALAARIPRGPHTFDQLIVELERRFSPLDSRVETIRGELARWRRVSRK